ncbi:hypothetical protein LOTGIDRAFT_169113 [Lottia gigantea]|uniref:Peroxisome biogenesis factor 2 n=1 Tax=Lottia gigantea TaxID=225164 RepID=V3YZK6_LOTGI|nr:hypothetical protein LOTGIDRAFT_169113 [Lottia gigantea]ESO83638.1 hypothetical protein LOTGIDRAFT_169113 [Lottia gigantea]
MYTVYCNGSTVGQELLNIKYGYSNRRSWITGRQKILYALLFIGCPWFKERLTDIVNILHLTQWHQQINKCIKWIENSLKLVTVCNFMLFLNRGGYINIIERLLGIQSLYPHSQNIRQVSFEFMTRELLWNGFSEFLFFILPLVNLQKIKNTIKRWTNRKTENIKTLCQRSDQDLKSCAVCSDWPINPHEIGCQHVFCYYCLFSNYKADPGFVCPLCNYGIEDETSLKPVELT